VRVVLKRTVVGDNTLILKIVTDSFVNGKTFFEVVVEAIEKF